MSSNTLFIQHAPWETRVALERDGRVVELQVERTSGRSLSGNIYRGRVDRVVAEMNAAFIDIGLDRMALLNASDVRLPGPQRDGEDGSDGAVAGAPPSRRSHKPISALLQPGTEVMVQAVREPVAKKGPRVTMFVTLPGRNIVFLPHEAHIGVSRMIDDPAERRRLHAKLQDLLEPGSGAIVRTVGEGATDHELQEDVRILRTQWLDIRQRYECSNGPSFLFADFDLMLRALRDLASADTETVWIDNAEQVDRAEAFLARFHPGKRPVARLYEGNSPLFAKYGVDRWIHEATSPTVPLKSGGQLVIDRTEAMTVIDINSERQIASEELENAVLKLNLEAAREIALQLRLRNIGGLVVVDFVDMPRAEDQRMLEAVFEIELRIDRARVHMGRLSFFGVIELSRKRLRESIYDRLTESCPTCAGAGYIRSASDLAIEVLARIRRTAGDARNENTTLRVEVPVRVAAVLRGQLADVLLDVTKSTNVQIELVDVTGSHSHESDIRLVRTPAVSSPRD